MDALRAEFPVLERTAYLNAGTSGPVPRKALAAVTAVLEREVGRGRADGPFFETVVAQGVELRGRVAALFGCDAAEVALTGSTTDGVNAVLAGLDLQPGDEILTSDEEHPGLTAPLAVARKRRGIVVRSVPFDELVAGVTARTRLVACSHVSWISGRVANVPALAAAGAPVLLDGAQGLGAVPIDVRALGCDFYAASGQKWLCGPNGSGYLYVRAERLAELGAPWPGYTTIADNADPFDPVLQADARMLDTGFPAPEHVAWALASLDVLEGAGLEALQRSAIDQAARLAERFAERGLRVAPRGDSTLVSYETDDPKATVERLRGEGIVVRDLPGTPYVRASVGGWTSEAELDRLVALAV